MSFMHPQQKNHTGKTHGAKQVAEQVHPDLKRHQANQQKDRVRDYRLAQVKDQTELS